jgi:hypothetical protein
VLRVRDGLSPRDIAVLDQVRDLKLMSGAQIQAVHFPLLDHATSDAAARGCRRVLRRLTGLGLLVRLERRVGGIRGGSAGYIYGIAPLGHRLLDGEGPRRRFREPSATFVHHTLAITQLVVGLIEGQRAGDLDILRLEPEPRCWRNFATAAGRQIVRPDMLIALGAGEFEHHWFVEMDLGTETINRRIVKCKQYQAYYRSGHEQEAHEIFPIVLWIVPTSVLGNRLHDAIRRTRGLTAGLFEITTRDVALAHLSGGAP